jgi:photosystem II stability/assembly factor-like uncharacterized protein
MMPVKPLTAGKVIGCLCALLALRGMALSPRPAMAGWLLQPSPVAVDLYDVTAHHGNINMAWVSGAEGTILFTSNGGATWIEQESGTEEDLFGIAFHEISGAVVAAGAAGTILRTTDQGVTWTPLASGTAATLRSVSDFGMFIAGDDGTILKGNQAGTSWSPMDSGSTADLFSISGAFSTYAVGEGGTILAYTIASGWFPRVSGTEMDLFGTPLFGSANYVAGDNGLILHSSNLGIDWEPQPVGVAVALRDLEFSVNNTSRIYAAGDAGVIVKTTDHGATWGSQQSGTSENLHGVFFYLDDSRGWVVGENGTILRTNDGGGPPVMAVGPVLAASAPGLRLASYPNPFRTEATLVFHLDRPGGVTVDLFDPAGRCIGTWRDEAAASGEQRIALELDRDRPVGAIFVQIRTPAGIATHRMLHIP